MRLLLFCSQHNADAALIGQDPFGDTGRVPTGFHDPLPTRTVQTGLDHISSCRQCPIVPCCRTIQSSAFGGESQERPQRKRETTNPIIFVYELGQDWVFQLFRPVCSGVLRSNDEFATPFGTSAAIVRRWGVISVAIFCTRWDY